MTLGSTMLRSWWSPSSTAMARALVHRSHYTRTRLQQLHLILISMRSFSSRRAEPRFKVPALVALYAVIMIPGCGLPLLYAMRNSPTEEELEESILKRYGKGGTSGKRLVRNESAQVGEFLSQIIQNNNEGDQNEAQRLVDAVMYGRRPDRVKYEDAIALKESENDDDDEEEEKPIQLANEQSEGKKKTKNREPVKDVPDESPLGEAKSSFLRDPETIRNVAGVTAVAVVAASVAFLTGGSRRS